MSVIAEFDVRNPHSALSNALAGEPDVELEMVQQVGTEPKRPYMFIWADAADESAWEAAMAADETVTEVQQYTEMDGEVLYRMQITEAAESVAYDMWVRLGGEQLDATWSDGRWQVRMRFPDREALAACRTWCAENDVSFELRRVYEDTAEDRDGARLTAEQEEVLAVAHELGYFEIPREASMSDLASELGISSQAVSERLRRGHAALVAEQLR